MLFRFEEEWKGGLKIRFVKDRGAGVACITLAGVLRLGEETMALRQQFDQMLLQGCGELEFDLKGLIDIGPAGLGQLVLFKETARIRGMQIRVCEFPLQADFWVIIG